MLTAEQVVIEGFDDEEAVADSEEHVHGDSHALDLARIPLKRDHRNEGD